MAAKPKQIDKFKAAARELGTDNDPEAFDRKMRGMKLKTKAPPKVKKSGKQKPG